jgi:hypothetical protein
MLPESDRKDLAIQALARSTTISDLSVRHGVSRKFVYQQARKAGAALDEIFLPGTPEDDVLFHLTVSKTWLRQVIVALTLVCRSSYRGVVEFPLCANDDETPAPFEFRLGHRRMTSWLCPTQMAQSN